MSKSGFDEPAKILGLTEAEGPSPEDAEFYPDPDFYEEIPDEEIFFDEEIAARKEEIPSAEEKPATPPLEQRIAESLKRAIRTVLGTENLRGDQKEDKLFLLIRDALEKIGRFYRMENGTTLFFRNRDHRLYELDARLETPFGRLVTYLTDMSVRVQSVARCIDRLRAHLAETAETVQVHALAHNSPDAEVIAINDFGGGMWYRRRGGKWEWKPNGTDGILFWTPPNFVEPWVPTFSTDPAIHDQDHLQWFLEQPHFADDILTAKDQRMLLKVLLLSPCFPSRNRTRPIPAHLGQHKKRQHDTGKTTGGKMIGHLYVGWNFEPTPINPSPEKGEEALQLTLVHHPFVLLDNVDTEIKWLNDFLCTYATGARPAKRRLYQNTEMVYFEYRGRLCLTSRKAKFNRSDTASRTIPFRFKPISPTERKTEGELLEPVIARRGAIWAGLLDTVARLQDALPKLTAPRPQGRLADFEAFGWYVAAVEGQEEEWGAVLPRLRAAQAGFAMEDEPLFPILQEILSTGDVQEQSTSEFYKQVCSTAEHLDPSLDIPLNASAFTKRVKELQELLESRLDVKIRFRTLDGQTLIRISRKASWEVTEVTEVLESLNEEG